MEQKPSDTKPGTTASAPSLLSPPVIVKTPDPPKYRSVHQQFASIFRDYSPSVTPKSIDEAVIDFSDTYSLYNKSLTEIAREIKKRIRLEIGEWISCSVVIGTNPFLPKMPAGLINPHH